MVFLCHNFAMGTPTKQNKDQIRKGLLDSRRKLSENEQHQKSLLIVENITESVILSKAKNIAFYHAVRGEADPSSLAIFPNKDLKQFYLPILSINKEQGLVFAPINAETQYKNNPFSIPEPLFKKEELINATELDLVIMPLLGFDLLGNRLGMGGGYYDRCFSFKNNRSIKKPILLGFAYDFQEVSNFEAEPWDIPLDLLATESRFITF